MSPRRTCALLALVAASLLPVSAFADPPDRERATSSAKKRARKADAAESRSKKRRGAASIGAPNGGKIERSVRLKPSKHLKTREGSRTWGLPQLVKALHRAADRVAAKHPGSVMLVGDLSARKGGKIEGHNSHQSGRDADIGLFATNSKGRPIALTRFVAFGGDGKATTSDWQRFDDERNWTLVDELTKDPKAGVRYVFVSNALRVRLLRWAASKRIPKDVVARVSAALASPDGADVHDDHFHVRITCPESMRDVCVEESTRRAPEPEAAAAPAQNDDAPASAAAPAGEAPPY